MVRSAVTVLVLVLWAAPGQAKPPPPPAPPPPGGEPQAPPAREGTGLILGTVVDGSSGRAVAGAVVSLGGAGLSPATGGQRILTDAEGQFARRFPHLPPPEDRYFDVEPGTRVLALIAQRRPESIEGLAAASGRAKSNLSRMRRTMERYGLPDLGVTKHPREHGSSGPAAARRFTSLPVGKADRFSGHEWHVATAEHRIRRQSFSTG